MTDDMIMVQWADLTGRGFSPHPPAGQNAPREYWAAAERLLDADLSQPPEGIKSTVGHPVWTLRRVRVDDRWMWCFAVQGRRGPFGVAGTCRFAFAPDGMSPHEAWAKGRAIAAADHEPERVEVDPQWFQDAVARLLAGLAFDQPALPIDADPVVAAAVIAAVLQVLPERTAALWSWSTCMLQKPDRTDRRVVSGRWPEEFRTSERSRAQTIEQIFRRGSIPVDEARRELDRQQHALRGFDQLVQDAAMGRRPDPQLLAAPSLMHMLIGLGHANRPRTWRDVGAMLDLPAGRHELLKMPKDVTEWAKRHPELALAALKVETEPGLIGPLAQGLMYTQSQSAQNLLGLPTAAEPELTEWHETLAGYLVESATKTIELKQLLGKWAQSDREAVHDWLLLLGLSPASEPVLFPPRARFVINQIESKRDYTEAAEAEVLRSENPLGFLQSLVEQIDPTLLSGASVGRMVASAARHPGRSTPNELTRVQMITAALTTARLLVRDPNIVLHWIDQVLTELRRQKATLPVQRAAMYGAIGAALDVGQVPAADSPLMSLCREIGTDNRTEPRFHQLLASPVEPRPAPEPEPEPTPPPARTEPLVMPVPQTIVPRRAAHRQEDTAHRQEDQADTAREPAPGGGFRNVLHRIDLRQAPQYTGRVLIGVVAFAAGAFLSASAFLVRGTPTADAPVLPAPSAVTSAADRAPAQHTIVLQHPDQGVPADAGRDAEGVIGQLPPTGRVRAVFIVVYPDPGAQSTGAIRGTVLPEKLQQNERLAHAAFVVVAGQTGGPHQPGTVEHQPGTVEVTVVVEP